NDALDSSATDPLKAGGRPAPATSESGGGQGGPDLEAHAAKQAEYKRKVDDYADESEKIFDGREEFIRSLPDELKEQANKDFDRLADWFMEMLASCRQLMWTEEALANPATSAENRQALLEREKKLVAEIDDMESNKPEVKTTGRPVSGEDGNDDEVLDVTRLLAAEEYRKNMGFANWYSNAYKSASEDASPEKRSQLLMVSKWYNNRGTIYAGLRDTQLALANPSISSDVRQALIGKERTLINLLKDSENYKPKYDPSLDLAVYNNGEPNSQSEQNKNGGGEQPESSSSEADKKNVEKGRMLKKLGGWLIRVLAINEPTSSIDTTPKSSDGTGNTVDQEQRVKVKVSRKQPPNPIPKRRVRRKSSTNATN
ncbi:hypothetical protein HG434_003410, partial [Candidatus Saccharibacteria bacterium]|nr:hypothetical protein [Candidatus Saccharibacteria bacterium]